MTREEAIKTIRLTCPKISDSECDFETAMRFLIPELAESEDEKTRKEIINFILYRAGRVLLDKETEHRFVAYLEKQKEKERNITANLLEDGITGVQRELIEFLANNIDASWVDIIKSSDAYAQRIRSMVEEQKAQLPTDEEILRTLRAEYEKGVADTIAKYEQKEQKPEERFEEAREKYQVEWSEEDDQLIGFIFDLLNDLAWRKDWAMSKEECLERLKSLRPQKLDASKLENFDPVEVLNRIKTEWPMAWEKVVGKEEWSEEDENKIKDIIDYLECWNDFDHGSESFEEYRKRMEGNIQFMKSLRPSWKPSEDEERLINTSISFLKDFADKGYENAVECIDWLKSKLNGNSCK